MCVLFMNTNAMGTTPFIQDCYSMIFTYTDGNTNNCVIESMPEVMH